MKSIGVVEDVAVVVVDDVDRAGVAHVHVEAAALPQPLHRRVVLLVRVVLADAPAVVADTVRVLLAARDEQELVVGERERRQHDDLGGLHVLVASAVDVAKAGGHAVVGRLDADDLAPGADLVAAGLERDGQVGRDRARLRVDLAPEAGAEPAVETGGAVVPEGIRPRARKDAGGLRERVVAERPGGLAEQIGVRVRRQRRVRVRAGAWPLERIATREDVAVEVPGLARCADVVLERVVVRLQLVVRDPPVLDLDALGELVLAVPVDHVRAVTEVRRQEPPQLRRPVDGGTADTRARVERPVLTHRQRGLRRVRPPRPRLTVEVDHHRVARRVAEAVVVVGELRVRPPRRPLLERHHRVARPRQDPLREDRSRPAAAGRHDVDLLVELRHQCTPSIGSIVGTSTWPFAWTPGWVGASVRSACCGRCVPCLSSDGL